MDGYPEILNAYLADRVPTNDAPEAIATGRPYLRQGQMHIFSEDLAPWLSQWEQAHRRPVASPERRVEYQARTPKEMDRFLLGIGSRQVAVENSLGAQPLIRQSWRLE